MKSGNAVERYLVLFLPWAFALLFSGDPVLSYFTAWLGSFLIFYLTLSGWVKPLPDDREFSEQMMRPIIIIQIIFAGYMCCTSIFYFLSVLGFENFQRLNTIVFIDSEKLNLTAQCQRYYCLAHASFVSGVLIFMNYSDKKDYYIETDKLANFLLTTAVLSFPVSLIFLKVPGLTQFYFQFSSLSFIAGTLALAFAIPLRKIGNTLICLSLYAFNFYQAFTSGFKEPIIISILVLGIFLYPNYKKLVTVIFGPTLILLFIFLPAYVNSFRQSNWTGDENVDNASQIALDAALNDNKDDSNWGFLVYRLSEIDMFTDFVTSTPSQIPYYGAQLVAQSGIAIIPRVFWPSKPNTEDLIMQRVYDAGVVKKNSTVSAKPAFVVDAYLSGGTLGIFICLFLYGATAQLISVYAEKIFGGYILGTTLIFSGLFQIMWRGLSFEFLINTVFWSFISMLVIHKILVATHILKKV